MYYTKTKRSPCTRLAIFVIFGHLNALSVEIGHNALWLSCVRGNGCSLGSSDVNSRCLWLRKVVAAEPVGDSGPRGVHLTVPNHLSCTRCLQ